MRNLDDGNSYAADGNIVLVLDKNNPLIGPLRPHDKLIKAFPTVRAPATPQNNAIFDQGEEFIYTLRAADACGAQSYPSGSGFLLGGLSLRALLTLAFAGLAGVGCGLRSPVPRPGQTQGGRVSADEALFSD